MASVTGAHACSATLTSTTADTVTFSGHGGSLIVTNRDSSNTLWVRLDGTTAVAAADENYAVPPSSSLPFNGATFGGTQVISVVGDGNAYTIGVF